MVLRASGTIPRPLVALTLVHDSTGLETRSQRHGSRRCIESGSRMAKALSSVPARTRSAMRWRLVLAKLRPSNSVTGTVISLPWSTSLDRCRPAMASRQSGSSAGALSLPTTWTGRPRTRSGNSQRRIGRPGTRQCWPPLDERVVPSAHDGSDYCVEAVRRTRFSPALRVPRRSSRELQQGWRRLQGAGIYVGLFAQQMGYPTGH